MRHFSLKQYPKWVKCVDAVRNMCLCFDGRWDPCLPLQVMRKTACGVCGEPSSHREESLKRGQADSALWTHWCTAVQREREDGAVDTCCASSSSSSSWVQLQQRRSAGAQRAHIPRTNLQTNATRLKNPATTHTITPRCILYVKFLWLMSTFSTF